MVIFGGLVKVLNLAKTDSQRKNTIEFNFRLILQSYQENIKIEKKNEKFTFRNDDSSIRFKFRSTERRY